ncbi:histidine-rich glycoprotein-like [Calliphora vicina]|uniref:histidine-rich glycoprotein-like n=1 Tax=Calliphora vicina TaxID=7373 RepID=UPI00325B8202
MRFLTSSVVIVLLAICGLAAAGVLPHHHQQHHHQQQQQQHHGHHVSSYSVVSKHEHPIVKHEFSHKAWEEHQSDNGVGSSGHELAHYAHKSDHEEDAHEDYEGGHAHEEEYYAHPKYQYDYAVKDEKTGDSKQHWETRDGDKVKGSYTIKEADGTTRIVEYTADHKNGFNAIVKTVGHAHSEHESHDHSHYSH